MKIFTFLLLCSIIIFINAADEYCEIGVSASSAKDCKDLKLSGSGNHFCYYKVKGKNGDGETQEYKTCMEKMNTMIK